MISLKTGSRLGPYEIISPIGAGGMGQVWKARDTRLDRIVAIKISEEEFSERFNREARAVAALNHPHICTLHDVGPNYLVMEYIDGKALEGPLSVDHALKYAGQICDALDAAHKKGIVHRDLKPGNIMVTKAGVKLLDFGLAHISWDVDSDAAPTSPVTQDGLVLGTLQYMSPEQLEGRKADARSDIYSLGLVIYEMVTGKRAFPHTDLEKLQQPALQRIVKTCLSRDPDARWQTSREVKLALQWTAENEQMSLSASAPYNRSRDRVLWALFGAILSTIILVGGWFWRAPSTDKVIRLAINPPESTVFSGARYTTVPGPQFALAPDGNTIVFAASSVGGRPMLWLRTMDQLDARSLPGTDGAENPFWSPDGAWVGFFADRKLKKVHAVGGTVQTVVSEGIPNPLGASWGVDDTILFATVTSPVFRVSAAGGAVSHVTSLDASRQEGSHRWPSFLPDGRHFLYLVRSALAEHRGLYIGSVDGKTKKRLISVDSSGVYVKPGYLLWVDGDTLLTQTFDDGRLELTGHPSTVAMRVGRTPTGYAAVSAQEGTLAYSGLILQPGRLIWFNRNGETLEPVGPPGDYADFRLSHDEKYLAASLVEAKTGNINIWLDDLTRHVRSPFMFGSALNATAIWSPDGTRLVFRSNTKGVVELLQKRSSGGGSEEVVFAGGEERERGVQTNNLFPSDWSPDGNSLLFSVPTVASGSYDLWRLPLIGDKRPVSLVSSQGDQIHGSFSPNGRLVAYSSNESDQFEILVQNFPGLENKIQVSTNGGYEPRWRADGRELYYLSTDRKLMAVSVRPGPSFDAPKLLFQTRVPLLVSSPRAHYDASRDGSRFLVNTQLEDPWPVPITIVLNWTSGLKK